MRASRVLAPALAAILGAVPSHAAADCPDVAGSQRAVGARRSAPSASADGGGRGSPKDGRVRVLFDHFDLDGDGALSLAELSALVSTIYHAQRALQVAAAAAAPGPQPAKPAGAVRRCCEALGFGRLHAAFGP